MNFEDIVNNLQTLQEKRTHLWKNIDLLHNSLRKYPSNNNLRKQSNGNKARYEELKQERDKQSNVLKKEIEDIQLQINATSKEIDELKALPIYKETIWKTERKPLLMKNLNDEMLHHLKHENYNVDFLIDKAMDSSLAREILICYESPRYGRGYMGYSMSANAWESQENRQKPISKWNKEDLQDFNSLFGIKTTLKQLKRFLEVFGSAGKHHTSKFYNETEHYSIPQAILNSTKQEFVEYFGEVEKFTIDKENK